MPAVSVIVPARDAAATLQATLRGLADQDVDHEVVVVDDGSAAPIEAPSVGSSTRVVRLGAPRGPGAARNAGVAASSAPLLAFTDADCVPEPGWLRAMLAAGGDLVQGPIRPQRPPGRFDRTIAIEAPSPLFETANLVVTRAAFEAAGGFPEHGVAGLPGAPHFGEDAVFGWRVLRTGAVRAWAPGAVVRHAVETRGARASIAERERLAGFAPLVAQVPELRDAFLRHRVVLPRRRPRDRVDVAAEVIGTLALWRGSLRARTFVV